MWIYGDKQEQFPQNHWSRIFNFMADFIKVRLCPIFTRVVL